MVEETLPHLLKAWHTKKIEFNDETHKTSEQVKDLIIRMLDID